MQPLKFGAIVAICLTIASQASAQLYDRGTARDGALLSQKTSPSATACRSACALDNSCAAWTWERPGEQGPEAMCRLQAEAVTAKPDNCCISGVSPASNPNGVRQVAALEVGAVEARHTTERADGGRDAMMHRPSRDHIPFTRQLTRYAPSAKPVQAPTPAEDTTIVADASEAKPQIEASDVAPVKKTAAIEMEAETAAAPVQGEIEGATSLAALEPAPAPAELAAPEADPVPAPSVEEAPVLLAAEPLAPSAVSSGPAAAFKSAPSRPAPVQTASADAALRPEAPAAKMTAPAQLAMPDEVEADIGTIAAVDETPEDTPAPSEVAQAAMTPAPAAEAAPVEAAPVSAPAPVSEPAPVTSARLLPDSVRPEPNPMISTADKRRAGQIALGEMVALNFNPTANDNNASKEADEEEETSDEAAETADTPEGAEKADESNEETVELAESGAAEAQGAGRQGYVHPSQRSALPRYSVRHEYAAPYSGQTASN